MVVSEFVELSLSSSAAAPTSVSQFESSISISASPPPPLPPPPLSQQLIQNVVGRVVLAFLAIVEAGRQQLEGPSRGSRS